MIVFDTDLILCFVSTANNCFHWNKYLMKNIDGTKAYLVILAIKIDIFFL